MIVFEDFSEKTLFGRNIRCRRPGFLKLQLQQYNDHIFGCFTRIFALKKRGFFKKPSKVQNIS
ncbi:MAG: hypothetical protein D6714_19560 [Bacteroidetes bacterium]|nr:MAG: hypothetical protein D6714_19560 [Bacteroidota bacterium]